MKFKFDKIASLEITGVLLLFTVLTTVLAIFGLWWIGLILDLLLVGFVILVIIKVHKYMKDVEADNIKLQQCTKYSDIRYMTKEQHDIYKKKGYIVVEDGIAVTKENIEEIDV